MIKEVDIAIIGATTSVGETLLEAHRLPVIIKKVVIECLNLHCSGIVTQIGP